MIGTNIRGHGLYRDGAEKKYGPRILTLELVEPLLQCVRVGRMLFICMTCASIIYLSQLCGWRGEGHAGRQAGWMALVRALPIH